MPAQRNVILTFSMLILTALSRCAFCDSQIPQSIKDALAANALALDPIDVNWDQRKVPVGGVRPTVERLRLGNIPRSNLGPFFETKRYHVSFSNSRLYTSRQVVRSSSIGRGAEVFEVAFDGETVFTGSVNRTDDQGNAIYPVLIKKYPKQFESNLSSGGKWISLELLEWWGIDVPENYEDFATHGFVSLVMSLMAEDGRVHQVESRKIGATPYLYIEIVGPNPERQSASSADQTALQNHLLRTKTSQAQIESEVNAIEAMKELPAERLFCFYLDPAMNYAVRRQERRNPDGTLLLRAENADFRKLPERSVWLPWKCKLDYFSFPSMLGTVSPKPILRGEFEVRSVETFNHPKERYQLHYDTPGTMVTDHTVGIDPVTYQVPADKSVLDSVVVKARDQTNLQLQTSFVDRVTRLWSSTMGRSALILGNVVLIIALLVILYRRNRG